MGHNFWGWEKKHYHWRYMFETKLTRKIQPHRNPMTNYSLEIDLPILLNYFFVPLRGAAKANSYNNYWHAHQFNFSPLPSSSSVISALCFSDGLHFRAQSTLGRQPWAADHIHVYKYRLDWLAGILYVWAMLCIFKSPACDDNNRASWSKLS